ncbi:MAG: hypothetical protein GEU28_14750 [Dehalococcoidia bacterium]|nr:hypothetical protein [Dehalococcoidia bacterium]
MEVLAHLVDVDYHWLAQAEAIISNCSSGSSRHQFVHFDDDEWKRQHAGAEELRLSEVIKKLGRSHRSVIDRLASLSDDDLVCIGLHPSGRVYSVREVFERYISHDENHAEQIKAMRRSVGAR